MADQTSFNQVSRSGKLKTAAKWIGICSIALIVLLVIGHTAWLIYSTRQLNVAVARLTHAGEPMTIAALQTAHVPDDQNAFVELEKAAKLLIVDGAAHERIWRVETDYIPPLTKLERLRLEAYLEVSAPILPLLKSAAARPHNVLTTPLTSPLLMMLMPMLSKLREEACILSYAAVLEHDAGHDDLAIQHLQYIEVTAVAGGSPPNLVGELLAIGIRSLQAGKIAAIAPSLKIGNAPGDASREQVRQLMQALQDNRAIDAEQLLAYRGERVSELDALENTRLGALSQTANKVDAVRLYLVRPYARSNALTCVEMMTDVIGALGGKNVSEARARLDPINARLQNLRRYAPLHMYAQMLLPSVTRAIEASYRIKADRTIAAAALAARLCEIETGHRPRAWDDLVPKYLAAVPLDPMAAGQAFNARFDGDDPILWSIGSDGVNDGGSDEIDDDHRKGRPRDTVFHLIPRPRIFDEQTQLLMDLDLDSPIRGTSHPATRPAISQAESAVAESLDLDSIKHFDVAGDLSAFPQIKTRRDVFAVLYYSQIEGAPAEAAVPATAPQIGLRGTMDCGSGTWEFELYPAGKCKLISPTGVVHQRTWTPWQWSMGDREFWQ